MPGWNLELSLAREQYLFRHNIWKESDKSQAEQIVTIMRYTPNHYHDLIKKLIETLLLSVLGQRTTKWSNSKLLV